MLYERWSKIAADRRNEWALHDLASGRRWTFNQLFAKGEKYEADGEIIFPTGNSPGFILRLLAAWRQNKMVCPLEPDQARPLTEAWRNPVTAKLAPQIPGIPDRHSVTPALQFFKCTSATAGASRLIAFTAPQLAADADNIVATMGLRADWPNLGVISLAHSYGFSNLILPLLLHGIPLILAAAPLPEIVRRAAKTEEAITLPAVPALWRAWHDARAIPANIRLAISAGAPLSVQLERHIFEATALKIHNFLGASECGGIAFDPSPTPRIDDALVGAPMQNVELSLNHDGCLVVRSRAVGETYWPEQSPALANGTFRSNDLAELKDGQVFLRGRLDDLINVAGRKVSPEAIERELLSNPKVRECLVFGLPSRDAERTRNIVAVVVSSAGESELKKFLLERLPAWQVPREWRFVDSLSANARGKISRSEWRRKF